MNAQPHATTEAAPAPDTDATPATCRVADLLWDQDGVARFREACIEAIGHECRCQEGKLCWLIEAALSADDTVAEMSVTRSQVP